LAGGEKTVCRFGWKYLRTDAPPSNLYGVDEADALGPAAELAGANRARKPDSVASAETSEARIISAQAPTFGTLAGRGEGKTNAGRNERQTEMDWRTENAKDVRLLDLRGLAPLDAGVVAADGDLVAMIEAHNTRTARAVEHVRQLTEDRRHLADFDGWQDAGGVDLAAERSRIRHEGWDAILGLRRVLEEREALLGEMEARLGRRYQDLGAARDRAVESAEKRLVGERRALEKANPYTAGGHFGALVADEEPVAEAAGKMAAAREALESVAAARRAVGGDLSAVTTRQHEVFAAMVA
jgi:hypothetical protein